MTPTRVCPASRENTATAKRPDMRLGYNSQVRVLMPTENCETENTIVIAARDLLKENTPVRVSIFHLRIVTNLLAHVGWPEPKLPT